MRWLRMVSGQSEARKCCYWPIRGQERWWGCILVKSKYRCHLLLSGSLAVCSAGCSQSAAVLQTQTNVPCMCCMLQSTWSLRHINKYTQTLMDTEHLFRDERLWCRIHVPQDIGMTSAPAQMQWLDLKWRYREKSVAHIIRTQHFWLGNREEKRWSFIRNSCSCWRHTCPNWFYLVSIFLENEDIICLSF